jgi:hypothetical protein
MLFVCHVCGKQYQDNHYAHGTIGGKEIDGVFHRYLACKKHNPKEIRAAFNRITGLNYPELNEDGSEVQERRISN